MTIMNKANQIISFSILFVISFLFLHSELDLFTPDCHIHNSHDFCDIVDNAKTENPNIAKFKINSVNVPVIILSLHVNLFCNSQITNIFNSKKNTADTDFTVLYNTFLI